MTTPGPSLNIGSEPWLIFSVFVFVFIFFSSIFLNRAARVVNYVAVSAVSSLPRTICFAMSGTFCRFDMLCDLRKKAALSNFLRDILHFMFVFVFSLFTLILSLKTELCRFFPTHNKTKLTTHKGCTIIALFCDITFDETYYLQWSLLIF